MKTRTVRGILVLLAASAGYVGVWASLAPHSFFTSFPGNGRSWLAMDGPFNEHLVRDVGALNLALLAITLAAAARPDASRARLTGLAWLVFSVPHLAYHVAHLGMYDGVDQVLNLVALGGTVALAAALCLPASQRSQAQFRATTAPADRAVWSGI